MIPKQRITRVVMVAALIAASAIGVAACGSSSSNSHASKSTHWFSPHARIRGQHITVLLPYAVTQNILKQFTRQTGVSVTYNTAGWDNVKSKLIVANSAGSYIADVTEFDWSFTGQFGGSGWYEPLQTALGSKLLTDLGRPNQAFETRGQTYAACYSDDYRLSLYNTKDFAKAGIKRWPTTFAQLTSDLNTLKRTKAAPYPMSLPLAATEGGLTPWYLLTLAMGGHLFNSQDQPVFGSTNSTAYKALQFEVTALKRGWVSPGSVTLDDTPALDNFNAGDAALLFAGGPGNLPTANDPSQSKIAPNARAGLIPGNSGPGDSFALPEGLAIPVTARHKDAAVAFIKWWLEPKTQIELYNNKSIGFLPCRVSVIHTLAKMGKLQSAAVTEAELNHLVRLFPQGAPSWYSKFDTRAQQLINAAVRGSMTPAQALSQLESYTKTVSHGGF